ncbi:hypothetical protein [Flavobacterium pectinovorum]|uniref:Highly acidic protein n=1 Tax=Flavobacterium pectinovorum TaxID=29533 RepID=A0AB36P0M3_9FLAO|nr:hypothetical protein [Flavobacterium pectinovorum]OXB04481.1 hypothetical protein B0A72_13385 [Flavobacterium pectinovorum]SHL59841.1 hypothetical protein SAMN05444387_1032 [Flavobacterium pectinovorum]
MTTNSDKYYDQNDNNTEENQSYVDQYQQQHIGDQNTFEQEMLLNEDQSYLDSEFSNALERDDQEDLEQNYDDSELNEDEFEEDDLEEEDDLDEDDLDDDLVEDYDENDREPETFADDGYKID